MRNDSLDNSTSYSDDLCSDERHLIGICIRAIEWSVTNSSLTLMDKWAYYCFDRHIPGIKLRTLSEAGSNL
jgi:hypothetical protein